MHRILVQRRGRSVNYRSSPRLFSFSRLTEILEFTGRNDLQVLRIAHEIGKTVPVMYVGTKDIQNHLNAQLRIPSIRGAYVGQFVNILYDIESRRVTPGAISFVPLSFLSLKLPMCNVFLRGRQRIASSNGSSITFINEDNSGRLYNVNMPSNRTEWIPLQGSYGFIGIIAGSQRANAPLMTFGRAMHRRKRSAVRPYRVNGLRMNPRDHPHGGGNHKHVGRPSTVSKSTPPGAKVGRFAPGRRRSFNTKPK